MNYYLLNINDCYFSTKTADTAPKARYTLVAPPESILTMYTSGEGITQSAKWVDNAWEVSDSLPMEGYIATPVRNRTVLSPREFKSAFTPPEYRAIRAAADTDDIVFQFWDVVQSVQEIDLTHEQTLQGMAYLVGTSLLTQVRHDEIMQGVS